MGDFSLNAFEMAFLQFVIYGIGVVVTGLAGVVTLLWSKFNKLLDVNASLMKKIGDLQVAMLEKEHKLDRLIDDEQDCRERLLYVMQKIDEIGAVQSDRHDENSNRLQALLGVVSEVRRMAVKDHKEK